MKKVILLSFFTLLISGWVMAQQVTLLSGDPGLLKSETKIGLIYDYSNVSVGKFDNEQDYIDKKVAEYNSKKPGTGDSWREKWISDRKTRFQPSFENKLNEVLKKKGVTVLPEFTDAKYTLVVKTTFIEPGYNIYISRQNASINVEVQVVLSADPTTPLAVILLKNMPGRTVGGDDYDTGTRISESYEKAGKDLGNYLASKVFKKK